MKLVFQEIYRLPVDLAAAALALSRVLFHNFDRYLSEYERRFEKAYRL